METKPLPLNRRIYQDLLDLIQSGGLNPGDTVPTEKELQQRYSVSRVPVRQALARLEAKGHIRRTPGRGTEVIHPRVVSWVNLSGFSHYYNRLADRITSRTLSVETVEADVETAGHFKLKAGDSVLKVHRLRTVDGVPVAYMNNYFSAAAMKTDQPDYASDYYSLQQIIQQHLRRAETDVEEDLTAVIAPADVAAELQVVPGTPVMFVTRRGFDDRHRPVEFSRYWARTDIMSYRTFMSTGSARGKQSI